MKRTGVTRRAIDIPERELLEALREAGGDLDLASRRLLISARAMRIRLARVQDARHQARR
jgi:hypothetical protein